MKVILVLIALTLFLYSPLNYAQVALELSADDGVKVSAEKYEKANAKNVIVLFHQAGSSKGEYRDIAPRLNRLGFTALAVDQRSGNQFGGVKNETATRVKVGNDYITALPDMRAAIVYAKQELAAEKVIIWGSSYSSSLALLLAGKNELPVDAVLAFSPGEYFGRKVSIADAASTIRIPVFITSARNEVGSWRGIFEAIPDSTDKTGFTPTGKGKHGSSTLLSKDKQEYWLAVERFLSAHFTVEP